MKTHSKTAQPGAPSIDPVCGMAVKAETPHRFLFEDDEILFCSAGCKAKFASSPQSYAAHVKGEAGKARTVKYPQWVY